MTSLSTHVLDTVTGRPAAGMRVHLAKWADDGWEPRDEYQTDDEGRIAGFGDVGPGRYRLGFETGEWGNHFYPFVHVVFVVEEEQAHYHVPLLLSAYGYSTYRGS